MAILDIVNLEATRNYWTSTPSPWILGARGSISILPNAFEFLEKNTRALVSELPKDILSLLDDIELFRAEKKPKPKRYLRTAKLANMISAANMPWEVANTRPPYQSKILDSAGEMIITGESLYVITLIEGITALKILLAVIDMYRQNPSPQSLCSCGHEQMSHLFIPGTSPCVERPCSCDRYKIA
jgi:hypothetical protein